MTGPADLEMPDQWARCNVSEFHSKSSAYAAGFSRGWAAAITAVEQNSEWLAEHDRQVAERAWNEGFDAGWGGESLAEFYERGTSDE